MMQGSLPHKLRLLRVQRGLTLVEAAALTRVTRATLSDLERGHRQPVAPTLAKIAEGYNIPVEELIEEPTLAVNADAPTPGPPEDRGDWLLKLLSDAASVYALDNGIELNWDVATYDHVIARLGETALQAAVVDLGAGNQERATEILRLWARVTTNLEARKALLEGPPAKAPERPAKIRHDLAEPEVLEKQLAGRGTRPY